MIRVGSVRRLKTGRHHQQAKKTTLLASFIFLFNVDIMLLYAAAACDGAMVEQKLFKYLRRYPFLLHYLPFVCSCNFFLLSCEGVDSVLPLIIIYFSFEDEIYVFFCSLFLKLTSSLYS